MLFLSLVLVPMLKQEPTYPSIGNLIRTVARRFRSVGWGAVICLILTGSVLLRNRFPSDSSIGEWPGLVILKLSLVGLLMSLALVHDTWIGPKVSAIKRLPTDGWTLAQRRLVRASPWLARLTLCLGLGILFIGVVLVRA